MEDIDRRVSSRDCLLISCMVGGEAKQDKNQPHTKICVDPACGHGGYRGQAVDGAIHGLSFKTTADGIIP